MELNTIYQGNCIELLKQVPNNSIDLIFADPPYNMQLKSELYRPNNTKVDAVDDDWDKFKNFKEYDDFCISWLRECRRILKDTGTIWVIGSYHNIFRVGNIMQNIGFWILNDVTWAKTNPMPNFMGTRFTNATETLLWCSKSEKSKYNFNYNLMKKYNGGKQMTSVWQIPICIGNERIKGKDGKKVHSTQKPEELLKRVILSSTNQNDLVLDPFFGTGTTGAVAKKLNRNFIGFEKEEKYIEVAQNRINNITDLFSEAKLEEKKKEQQQKVPLENLLKEGYLHVGDILFAKGKQAKILEDGTVSCDNYIGSIHRIAAIIKNANTCNGWTFWHIKKNNNIVLLNDLRNNYLKKAVWQE